MFFNNGKVFLIFLTLTMTSCSGSKTVYRQNELDMATIQKEFIQKKRAVKLRFYVLKDLMYEETGYIISSPKENYIVFQYYEHTQRKFVDVELPLKNISELSYKKGAFEFDRSTKIAGITALVVSFIIAVGIWI